MFDLSGLNKEQREAVEATDGAVLVLASAGTGKTRVLTSRIAYIVSQGLCSINEILAVTFTNKAAKEMKERAISLLNQTSVFATEQNTEALWIGTFHALALKMIRPLHDKFRRTSNFAIVDADDQVRIIRKIIKEFGIDDKKYAPKQMSFYINRWKDQCRDPDDAKIGIIRFSAEEVASKIYKPYQDTLESLDAIDFGDILKIAIEVFKYNPEVLLKYQDKFKYIMVDEYQDTNAAQYIWLTLLSMSHGNICCVGDDDQSIYSWRGADVGNILKFDRDFKNPTVIRLGQNYRSTGNIISAASGLIANNSMRMKKEFWTDQEEGLPVIVKSLQNPTMEANFIAALIENKQKNGLKFSEMAVLVRTAVQTRAFEERFLTIGIPYTVVGGVKFYERREVKDAVAYLRLAVNQDDSLAFERIVNLPKRGIGSTTMNKFFELSRSDGISLPSAARRFENPKLTEFFRKLDKWGSEIDTATPSDLMKRILIESEYLKMLQDSKAIEDEARIENLDELITALKGFESVREFLDYISLVLDNSDSTIQDRVIISTIHAAKGLEYHTIFIPGFEENIIPHKKSVTEKGDIGVEEERRLCYVAITRAKKEAYITLCNRRNMYGSYDFSQFASPSRFLYDLPKNCIRILQ
ncbi:MAG: UvrD-helicase domain-containing protein [Holosporales bacterium]|nr:UvrD-helicase domain-containing protein [Holosporales bacterium]